MSRPCSRFRSRSGRRPGVERGSMALLVALLVGLAGTEVRAEPLRVACLLPFVEEALARIPEHASLVAATRSHPGAKPRPGIVDLGSPHSPDLESLALARPDVVVGDHQFHAAHREALGRTGAEVMLLDTASVETTFEGLVALAARAGAETHMEAIVAEQRAALAALRPEEDFPVLALFAAPGGSLVVTERTWLGDLLARLGFRNVAAPHSGHERFPGYVELSDEVLPLLEPRMVVLVAHGAPEETERAFRERLRSHSAWKRVAGSAGDAVHVLEPRLFRSNPGLALPEAAEALVALADATGTGLAGVGAE